MIWLCRDTVQGRTERGLFEVSSIAAVTAWRGRKSQFGSGFLFTTRHLVTAAHVVLLVDGDEVHPAEGVEVDLGYGRFWADRLAVPKRFWEGEEGHSDIAVLRFPFDVCEDSDVLLIPSVKVLPRLSEQVAARVWGRSRDTRWQPTEEVVVGERDGYQTYDHADLPGHSGGALVAPPVLDPGGRTAIGVHRRHVPDVGCQAVPLTLDDLQDAVDQIHHGSNLLR